MQRSGNNPITIDEYIAAFPEPVQNILREMRAVIRAAAPDAEEKISYQMPTFYQNGNLVHFAAYEHHIGFYPTPSAIAHFQKELAPYKSAKGSVQFQLDQPVPFDLVRRMTAFRLEENMTKAKGHRKARANDGLG